MLVFLLFIGTVILIMCLSSSYDSFVFHLWVNFESLISAKYDVESVEDIPVAVKNKMNINFTLNLDER